MWLQRGLRGCLRWLLPMSRKLRPGEGKGFTSHDAVDKPGLEPRSTWHTFCHILLLTCLEKKQSPVMSPPHQSSILHDHLQMNNNGSYRNKLLLFHLKLLSRDSHFQQVYMKDQAALCSNWSFFHWRSCMSLAWHRQSQWYMYVLICRGQYGKKTVPHFLFWPPHLAMALWERTSLTKQPAWWHQ